MKFFEASRTLSVAGEAIPNYAGVPVLIPTRLSGTESVNELFDYRLGLSTPDGLNLLASGAANFSLDAFIGQQLTVSIELEGSGGFVDGAWQGNLGAGTRHVNALVTDARLMGEHGRQVLYEFTLSPWLHLATLRSNCRIHQNKSAVQVLDALLVDYVFPVEKRLIETYPIRDYITQYNESDFAFFCRLCEEWGISYFFAHGQGRHCLVLVDNMAAYQEAQSPAYRELAYFPPGHRIDEEYVESFEPMSHLTSGRFSTTDYDYTRPRADLRASRSDPRPTAHATQEVYAFHADVNFTQPRAGAGQVANEPRAEAELLTLLRLQSLRGAGRRAKGFGHLRGVAAGFTFELTGHPQDAANAKYLVLRTELDIAEVGEESRAGTATRLPSYRADLHFEVHPPTEALRPERKTPRPSLRPQTARVVGPEGQEMWTDALGRIKVQFHWDRYGTQDQDSSCWLRVVEGWAGNQFGSTFLPRIGQEVLVDYIDGDVDLPLCAGRLANQNNLPPLKLPDNQSVSVIRSRELTRGGGNASAGRSNQLVFDDTAGHIQAQLRSDHLDSQLSLGDITRIESHPGRADPRGEGFELRTDGHGVIRAQAGLLVTTEARTRARGAMKDMAETLSRLNEAREEHATLAHAAQIAAQNAESADAKTVRSDLAKALDLQGQALRGSAKKFPELEAPHLVLASPAGIGATTSGSTHLDSREHTAVSTGRHLSFGVMGSWFASVRDTISIFARRFGITLTAAKGPIRVEAQDADVEVIAQKVLTLMSAQDWVKITAKKGVLINGGGSYIRLDPGGIEVGTEGNWVVYSASKHMTGPKSLATASRTWQDSAYNDGYIVKHPRTGEAMKNVRYSITREDSSVFEGVTDATGRIPLERNIDPTKLEIRCLGLAP